MKMVSAVEIGDNNTDSAVDEVIRNCLTPEAPQSFFLYAGAGSGKTYSLVKALEDFNVAYGESQRRLGKKVAVITYTNAACDEIIERVKGGPLFHISTIHSFCWAQIKSFNDDIRRWLQAELPAEIEKLEIQEAKGRAGTQASVTRQRSMASKRERLDWLSSRREFTYSSNGDNIGKASLSHPEVLQICACFLLTKPSFAQMVVSKYPFLLIDESQDTNKQLVEAFFELEKQHQGRFGLGLIGDMMQRIYGDGKPDLGKDLPDRWQTPVKKMNRRSPSRIIALANDIRSETDEQKQCVLQGKGKGYVRLYIASAELENKPAFEREVREAMAVHTSDELWKEPQKVKHLMLEHMMAASRMGFSEMYSALKSSKRLTTGLNGGDLPAVRLFSEYVLPLYHLEKAGEKHGVMNHIRRSKSPLLHPDFLKASSLADAPLLPLKQAINSLVALIDEKPDVSFQEVLLCVSASNLFSLPQSLFPFAENIEAIDETEGTDEKVSSLDAISNFLQTPFNQIESYRKYVSGEGSFDTHQGVKGREFNRVLVVMDDEEAGGFLFSYEKLFEVKSPTKNDIDKLAKGEDTGVDRTRRLFYVTCTRAEESLALVAYSNDPELLKQNAINKGWFNEGEIVVR